MRGGGPGRARAYLLRLRPPLRARPSGRPQSRHPPRVRGPPRRRTGLAAGGLGLPTQRLQHLPRRGAVADRVRLLSRGRASRAPLQPAEGRGRSRARDRRPANPGAADARATNRGVAPSAADARRPGVRGRGLTGDRRVRRVASRHRGAAGHACARLRGVRAAVPRELVRAGDSLAPLHRVHGHDLRRPRRARRLEHLRGLGGGDAPDRLVGRACRGGADVLLGLPAPRQPRAGGPSRPRIAPAGEGGGRRGGGPGRVRVSRRPADRRQPVELLPRRGRHARRGRGLARRARAGGGPAIDGRRRRSGTGSPSTPRGTWTTC